MRYSSGAYNSSLKNNWLDEFFPDRKTHHDGYWNNKELCKEEAKKYKSRSLFCSGNWVAYNYSQKNNWLDEFFGITSKNGYWNNKELCKEETKKYRTKSEFEKKSNSAYKYSKRNNWLDEFFPIKKPSTK